MSSYSLQKQTVAITRINRLARIRGNGHFSYRFSAMILSIRRKLVDVYIKPIYFIKIKVDKRQASNTVMVVL